MQNPLFLLELRFESWDSKLWRHLRLFDDLGLLDKWARIYQEAVFWYGKFHPCENAYDGYGTRTSYRWSIEGTVEKAGIA